MKQLLAFMLLAVLVWPAASTAQKAEPSPSPPPRPTLPTGNATAALIERQAEAKRLAALKPVPKPVKRKRKVVRKRRAHHALLPAQVPVASGANLQTAITAASCGDFLNLEAGATWDGTFVINQNCTAGNPLTIRSANHALLPNGRVGATNIISDTNPHSANMARIRTVGGGSYGAAFVTGTNAGGIVFDGLEITDNAAQSAFVHFLFDLGVTNSGVHDVIIDRSWIHQKETGTNWNRTAQRAVQAEGTNITIKRSYIYLVGYYYSVIAPGGSSVYPLDTTALLCVGGAGPLTMDNNFVSVWWNGLFTGGGDTAPQHTATLTSASTTGATFSAEPPPVGTVVRFSVEGTATKSGGVTNDPNFVRLTGPVLTQADGVNGLNTGGSTLITSVADPSKFGIANLHTISEPNWSSVGGTSGVTAVADGEVTWELYQTARIDSVGGDIATFTPIGVDELNHTPTKAAWNLDDEGVTNDVLLQGNTFRISAAFATAVYATSLNVPKGWIEIKSANRITLNGNYWLEYPSVVSFYSQNQNGTAPWVKTQDITVTNNWFAPDAGYEESTRSALTVNDGNYLHTVTPTTGVIITNNFAKNLRSMAQVEGAHDALVAHNTFINTEPTLNGYNALVAAVGSANNNWTFRDNIAFYVVYGIYSPGGLTFAQAFPAGVFLNNVIVDDQAQSINANQWGVGSILNPVPTTLAGIGFTNAGADIYSLAPSSNYKGDGTGGTDPGVNWGNLLDALGALGAPGPTFSTGGKSLVGGKAIVGP